MIFYQINAGGDRNFAYLLGDKDGGKAALFDPPPSADRYQELVDRHHLQVEFLFLTHGHGDHTWGMAEAVDRFDCKVVGHQSMRLKLDLPVEDDDIVAVGELEMKIIYTPGHSDDAICILCEDKLITGDTLFVGKVGGTDLGEGARKEWDSLYKLMKLPSDVEVWPGHDFGVEPSSTIGHELKTNPFLLRKTFDDFVELKANWIQYKKEHGIK
jgi:hydroxyacylglutathione hydrolase